MLTDDEFRAWFRLLETPGLGRADARALLAACGSPEAVFDARPETLRRIVDNGRVILSSGVSAGIDMSLHVVARLLGDDLALETARYMEYEGDWRRA